MLMPDIFTDICRSCQGHEWLQWQPFSRSSPSNNHQETLPEKGEGHFGAADSALDNSAPCRFGTGRFGAGF